MCQCCKTAAVCAVSHSFGTHLLLQALPNGEHPSRQTHTIARLALTMAAAAALEVTCQIEGVSVETKRRNSAGQAASPSGVPCGMLREMGFCMK